MANLAMVAVFGCGISGLVGLLGCGLPGPPQPPSLQLPQVVSDLHGERVGDAVTLGWTVPAQTTDKTAIKGPLVAEICRMSAGGASAGWVPVGGQSQSVAASASAGAAAGAGATAMATVEDELPPELRQGAPRAVAYRIEVKNARGRSAGWSAPVAVLAGQAPPAVRSLQAQSTASGVRLAWQNGEFQPAGGDLVYRITRTLLTPQPISQKKSSPAEKSSPVQTLEVASAVPIAEAMDRDAAWNQLYRYQVQAVLGARVDAGEDMRKLEMLGIASNAVEVATKNVFPPAAPQGLVGVAIWGNDGKPAIDLNWQPETAATLVGYQVYRVSRMPHRALAARTIASGEKTLNASAFTDRDLDPGIEYEYTVVAVDKDGNVSAESNQVRITTLTSPD